MNQMQTFGGLFSAQAPYIGVGEFAVNLLLTAALAFVLAVVYVRYGASISNRRMFARNLIVISMTTMLIITIVKSSLALSLGLVGALSIVRFRTAIKEPEELSYLFLSIAIGLGMGAGQRVITVLGFVVISLVVVLRAFKKTPVSQGTMMLTVSSDQPGTGLLDRLVTVLEKQAASVSLKRIDETKDSFQGDFLVSFSDYQSLKAALESLREIDTTLRFSFLDSSIL